MSRQLEFLRTFPAALVLAAADEAVFNAPRRAELHQSAFLAQCLKRVEASTR